jgi:hypothetical protein
MAIIGVSSLASIKLIIVVLGLFLGATQFGWPVVRLNISLRVLIAKPSSEKNTDLSNAPPLGVAHAMFPAWSTTEMCVVPLSC